MRTPTRSAEPLRRGAQPVYAERPSAIQATILQRVAGLERKRQLDRPALSLAEVEAIARESGIDPCLVRQAARDLEDERQTGFGTRLAGAPVRRTFERAIDGEISARHHEQLADDIRAAMMGVSAMPAQVSKIGRSLNWSAWTSGGVVETQVTPREGKTFTRVPARGRRAPGRQSRNHFRLCKRGELPHIRVAAALRIELTRYASAEKRLVKEP